MQLTRDLLAIAKFLFEHSLDNFPFVYYEPALSVDTAVLSNGAQNRLYIVLLCRLILVERYYVTFILCCRKSVCMSATLLHHIERVELFGNIFASSNS